MLPVGEVLVPKARVAKPTPRPRGRPTTLFVDTPEGPVPALELAKKNGVPRATMYDRIERKWPLEKAVSVPAHNYGDPARQLAPPRPRAPADKTTHTREIRALAAKNGISEQLYYYRVANGWSQEKASTHPPYHRPERLKGTRRAT